MVIVIGEVNKVLPGNAWTQYDVVLEETQMVCTNKKDNSIVVSIPYSSFKEAEFGIGSGNLWLQCNLENGTLNFCSPRKYWKSEEGKKLIAKINEVTEIKDMKSYKQYTGPFFIFAMFK